MIHFLEKIEFCRSIPNMQKLAPITILRTNSKIVEVHTFKKLFPIFSINLR